MSRKDVFAVLPPFKEGGKNRWVRIGAAFSNRDGSLSVLLDALPVDGKMQIRDYVPKEDKGGDFRNAPPANNDTGDSDNLPF